MTVTELIAKLSALFPRAKDWIHAWSDSFRRVLAGREGEDLRIAYERTMDGWSEPGCPKPAAFAANLPARAAATPGGASPAVNRLQELERQCRKRAAGLERGWTQELAEWFSTAKAEGWEGCLRLHVRNLAEWCARCEANGRSLDDAITRFNAHDYRGRNTPPRAPDCLVDERDADIFRRRLASQERFGKRRVRKESAWMAQRRAEINARIREEAPA